MYGDVGCYKDNHKFSKSIMQLDYERQMLYNSKTDVANDLDHVFSDQYEVCSTNNLGHSSDIELGLTPAERWNKECFAFSTEKR